MSVVIHDFRERLARSFDLSSEPAWVDFYREQFGSELLSAVRMDDDSKWQRWGCDRILYFKNGNQILVDEKKRDKDWGDFLAEIWSVGRIVNGDYVGEKIGWTLDKDKRCHYVAYAVIPASRCTLLPFDLLRMTAQANWQRWTTLKLRDRFPAYPKDALNRGYLTRNCAVEWSELWRAMREQSQKHFGSKLELPVPIVGEQYLLFEHGEAR